MDEEGDWLARSQAGGRAEHLTRTPSVKTSVRWSGPHRTLGELVDVWGHRLGHAIRMVQLRPEIVDGDHDDIVPSRRRRSEQRQCQHRDGVFLSILVLHLTGLVPGMGRLSPAMFCPPPPLFWE